jgi:hypothetical protein
MQPMLRVQVNSLFRNSTRFLGFVAEEGNDHVECDTHLVGVLFAQQAAQRLGQPRINHGTRDGGKGGYRCCAS